MPTRRRAEEFAALVDGGGDASGTPHDDLVELVTALRGTPLVSPRPEFVTELRASLMAEAEVALSSVDARLALPAHTRTRHDRRVAIAAGTLALLGAGTSLAVAAQDALPGDALYPIKRVIEGAQSTLQVDQITEGELLLSNASSRLDEVSALQARNSAEGIAAMPETLDDFATQADNAADVVLDEYDRTGDREPVTELRQFASDSMDTLVELGSELPSSARSALEHAAQVIKRIDDRAAAACPKCGGGIVEVPQMFLRSFSDGLVSPSTSTAPPVVIVPVNPGDAAPDSGGGTGGSTGSDGAGTPTLPATDGGSGDGATDDDGPVRGLTKKLLGDQPASAPKDPVEDLGDTVVDPLLGGVGDVLDPLQP
ncbi:MAG: DUF5667 domain-containing protein [Nocardioides sp.]